MDSLVTPQEHLCYVRCAYCSTVLAVGVPCKRMMDSVTVKCGHCNSLSYLNPRSMIPSLCSDLQMGTQGPCSECRKSQQLLQPTPSALPEETVPKAPYVVKPPEKKHRLPSAYNRFMREEIQRIKAAQPDIPHREAFSTAAKNWAKCDPRAIGVGSTNDMAGTSRTTGLQHGKSNGVVVESFDIFKHVERRSQ